MKRIFTLLLMITAVTASLAQTRERPDSLLQYHRFFELRDALETNRWKKLPEYKQLYYRAYLKNFFNELEASNEDIDQLLTKYKKQLSEKETGKLLAKKADNHVKLYQYRQAYEATQQLLEQYGNTMSAEDKKDAENSALIWKGLENTGRQTTAMKSDTRIAYTRDMAKLINIPVRFSDSTFSFVFDTGANLSVISESYAGKANLRLLNTSFRVGAITGIEVTAELGVADELSIGDIVVRNVVFIVFPDSALSFAGGAYKINGIIGFPVIEQLKEIHITKDGFMSVPLVAGTDNIQNMGIDELVPMVNVAINGRLVGLRFDTGSQTTFLNKSYYRKFKKLIDATGKPFNMKYGGAGGTAEEKAFLLPETQIAIAGKKASLTDLAVKTTGMNNSDNYHYGTLGQDVINQFQEMIINFQAMYLKFE